MNYWTSLSIEYANQRNYLDELFRVYPLSPEGIREIDQSAWEPIETAFDRKDKLALLCHCHLLAFKKSQKGPFPFKDSYVPYLGHDPSALERNPATVDRLCGRLFEMGLNGIYKGCSRPKETNTQIGPLFKRWVNSGSLGADVLALNEFLKTDNNAILDGGDAQLLQFAKDHLGYDGAKGLDFIARFNRKYVIGEAKLLTDFGGNQDARFADTMTVFRGATSEAIRIAIMDGVLYIEGKNTKMPKFLREHGEQYNIMSALVLREFLYQV